MISSTAENVRRKVAAIPVGRVFTYRDVMSEEEQPQAVIKSLNRLVNSGGLSKLSRGKFFRAEKTPFGHLMPAQEEVVRDLLIEDGRVVGYLTGLSIYNRLGLTTQVANTIEIGRNDLRPAFGRERYRVRVLRQKNKITADRISLLQFLDVLRWIKKIPDTTIDQSIPRMLQLLSDLSDDEVSTLTDLAQKYPPSTRALLGALLEDLNRPSFLLVLRNSLNPLTTYGFEGASSVLQSSARWNIK